MNKIKVEPNEIFFYLDKLIRTIKIKNNNEYAIKFELLTVLNEKDVSPLQASETQNLIESNKSFTISLEYIDTKDINYDSIIILTIYKLINDESKSEIESINVPFHFRNINLLKIDHTNELQKKLEQKDLLSDFIDSNDQTKFTGKLSKKTLPKTQKSIKKIINKKDDKNIDDLDINDHNQMNSLRYEDDNVRKYVKILFLITFLNLIYTIFLVFISPINQIYNEIIDNFNLNDISNKCSSWTELNQLIKNITCKLNQNK